MYLTNCDRLPLLYKCEECKGIFKVKENRDRPCVILQKKEMKEDLTFCSDKCRDDYGVRVYEWIPFATYQDYRNGIKVAQGA